MSDSIMVGCDLHDKTMVLKFAAGREPVRHRTFDGDLAGRQAMIGWLRELQVRQQADRILFAYEASSRGFGLYDDLREAEIECFVLAPTRIARSPKQARGKNDQRDATQILELLRAHVLAGNDLPAVWVPDQRTRDDRELIRMRLTVADRLTVTKNQVQSLLKRNELRPPEVVGKAWTRGFRAWLMDLSHGKAKGLGLGGQAALASLLRQMEPLEAEIKTLDQLILTLSQEERYAPAAGELDAIKGVGILTAMVFLTELGDLSRFSNRRQLAAYLGLIPSSSESGDRNDCKGHITRQGSGRVRKVLCQATWSIIGKNSTFRKAYDTLVERNPKHKKIAVVAIMRRLAILMWHRALDAKRAADRDKPPGVAA
jgi:transposase